MKKNKVNNIDEALKKVEERKQYAEDTKFEAEQVIEEAKQTITEAKEEIKELYQTVTKLQKAKKKQDEANKECDEALEAAGYEKNDKKKNNKGLVKGIVIGATAISLIVGGYHLVKNSKKLFGNSKPGTQNSSTNTESAKETVKYSYNYEENVVTVNNEEYVELTTEEFEKITSLKIKELSDKGVNLSSEDIIKYMMIVNCDKLAQDNKELINEVMGEQSSDEIQQDANKFVGAVVMYNYNIWYKEGSTRNFIRVSDTIFDKEAREKVVKIERRVDQISLYIKNKDKVNELVNDLLKDLLDPTNELSYLESGVGYSLQIILEPVRGLFADGLLNEENTNLIKYFVPYASDEEEYKKNNMVTGYIKDIKDILSDCLVDGKKLTK